MFLILFENTESIPFINRWRMVYTVCASAVISPLRQVRAQTRLKMCHTLKHFIHMQCF